MKSVSSLTAMVSSLPKTDSMERLLRSLDTSEAILTLVSCLIRLDLGAQLVEQALTNFSKLSSLRSSGAFEPNANYL